MFEKHDLLIWNPESNPLGIASLVDLEHIVSVPGYDLFERVSKFLPIEEFVIIQFMNPYSQFRVCYNTLGYDLQQSIDRAYRINTQQSKNLMFKLDLVTETNEQHLSCQFVKCRTEEQATLIRCLL